MFWDVLVAAKIALFVMETFVVRCSTWVYDKICRFMTSSMTAL